MSRSAYARCWRTSYPEPLGYLYAFHPATSANAAITAAAASSARRKLGQQISIPPQSNRAVGFALDPFAPAPAHLGQVVLAVVGVPDRACEQLGAPRRYDHPAADLLDDLRRLAVGVGGDDHGPGDGEDAVEPARDDIPGETPGEADHVDVCGRQRLGQHATRLVVEELDLIDVEEL